jgi:CHAT domain-containing protein
MEPFPAAVGGDVVEQIASLGGREAVERFLEERPELLSSAVVAALADEVPRLVHTALGRAERLAEAASWLALRLDARAQARARRTAAHILYARGEHEAAVSAYDAAREMYERLADEAEVGRTLSSSLQALIYLGRYAEAEAHAGRARTIFEGLGDRLRLARLDINVANLHYRRDRFAQALGLYQRAQAALREVGTPNDVAVTLRNMAVCHISLNDFAQALAVHREAREFCESHGLARLVVEADYNIAYLHYLRGEYTLALELYQAARARAEALGDAYHRALCDLDQSELYLELNLLEEGVALAEQAFAGFEALQMPYETAKALTNLAVGVGRQGEVFRSLQLFARARKMFVGEGNDFWPALIDIYRGLVLHQEGRHFEARKLCQDALRFFDTVGHSSKAALAELVLARIHLAVGELVSGRVRSQRALARLQGESAPDLSHRAHFLLGQAEEALGFRAAAVAAYEAARHRLENLRSHLEQDELKIGFLKDKLAVYESLVALRVAGLEGRVDIERAFTCIEQAKSRSLADLLAFRASALPASSRVRSSFVEQVHGLRQELNWYYRTIDLAEVGREPRSPQHLESLRRESRGREAELLRLLREAGGRDPEFASLQSGRSVDLESIRSTLPLDTTVLEFYLARGMLLAAILTHGDLTILPVSPASRVRHELQLLQFQLAKFRLGDRYVRTFEEPLREATAAHLGNLYADLIGPVRERLRTRRLVVVPHDFLHYVPFHALLDGPRALIDDFVVSYAPSASVHHLCCAKAPSGEGSLVMGVPDEATPHIVREVTDVARALPSPRVFIGDEATEAVLRQHGATSRFIHLATHGRFRHDNPMFSSVQLGTSRLSLFDLYQLELPCELVTLSGCATGLNVAEGGDELLGLVRGLLYAGTQSALVTLWDVNDLSTSEFMSRFYVSLGKAGQDKGIALQLAMRELRESRPHPYYWAPFVLVGRGA